MEHQENKFSRKCPICGKELDRDNPCNHLLLVLRNTEMVDILDENNDAEKKQIESYKTSILQWKGIGDAKKYQYKNAPEEHFNTPVIDKQRSIIPSEFLEEPTRYYGTEIVPYYWGKDPLDAKLQNCYMYTFIEYLGFYSPILIRITKILLDTLCKKNKLARINRAYLEYENGEYCCEIDRNSDITELDVVCEIEYWQKDSNMETSKLDEYMILFFSLTQEDILLNKLSLETALEEISRYWEFYQIVGIKQSGEQDYIIPAFLINRIFLILGKESPLSKSLDEKTRKNIIEKEYLGQLINRKEPYERETKTFVAFMALLTIDELLHDRIKNIWHFVSTYKIGQSNLNDAIISIEKQFNALRKCVEELELPLLEHGERICGYDNWSKYRTDIDKLSWLYKNGEIDRYLNDSLSFIYSLLSWKSHGRKNSEKKQEINRNPAFLMMVLKECFKHTLYNLLPRSVALMTGKKI